MVRRMAWDCSAMSPASGAVISRVATAGPAGRVPSARLAGSGHAGGQGRGLHPGQVPAEHPDGGRDRRHRKVAVRVQLPHRLPCLLGAEPRVVVEHLDGEQFFRADALPGEGRRGRAAGTGVEEAQDGSGRRHIGTRHR
ncbi:hypothetical protein ACFSTC_38785 [Nonomuraea ferruginea]